MARWIGLGVLFIGAGVACSSFGNAPAQDDPTDGGPTASDATTTLDPDASALPPDAPPSGIMADAGCGTPRRLGLGSASGLTTFTPDGDGMVSRTATDVTSQVTVATGTTQRGSFKLDVATTLSSISLDYDLEVSSIPDGVYAELGCQVDVYGTPDAGPPPFDTFLFFIDQNTHRLHASVERNNSSVADDDLTTAPTTSQHAHVDLTMSGASMSGSVSVGGVAGTVGPVGYGGPATGATFTCGLYAHGFTAGGTVTASIRNISIAICP